MNDPKIIEWLNSHDSDEWRTKQFPVRINLLRVTVKDDGTFDGQDIEPSQYIYDTVEHELGVF